MKRIIQFFTVLSWINFIGGLFLVLMGLLTALMAANGMAVLISVVLTGSIALHSYAALQLRKSLAYPQIPLDSRVPQGIYIVGFIALFFAVTNLASSFALLRHNPEIIKALTANLPEQYRNMNIIPMVRIIGIVILLFSLSVMINVILSFNLLRWYRLRQDQQQQ